MEIKENKIIGLEIGGTNIKGAVISSDLSLGDLVSDLTQLRLVELKTHSDAEETVKEISSWILSQVTMDQIECLCISMFGPLCLNRNSENFGQVLNTPKPGWKNFNIVHALSLALNISKEKIKIEVDVGCAALLEYKYGNHNVDSLAYITIGTGVGVGLVVNGNLIHGLQHPEGGHIRVKRHHQDTYEGNCPLHSDCLEGLVANNSIRLRKGLNSVDECENLKDEDEVWDFCAFYISQVCLNLLYLVSIEKIIIGGGIINRQVLLDKIRKNFIENNNNYIDHRILQEEKIDNYITRTQFKNAAGILSAFALK